jgi:hypothetical protein
MAVLLSLLIFPALALVGEPAAAMTMSVGRNQIVVQGVAPNSGVILYGVALEPYLHSTRIVERSFALPDADGDGAVTYTSPTAIPFRSIWIAVDQQSGAFVIAGPEGYPVQRFPFDQAALRRNQAGEIASLESARPEVYTLVVRPHVGAWKAFTRDGGSGDADEAADGTLGVRFGGATAIGPTVPTPDHLTDGDVVVVIDPLHMDVTAAQLGNAASDVAEARP